MKRDERGATAVEFAIVVPLLLALVGIAAYFGWRLYTESQLERAAQRAARHAAIPANDGTYAYRHCDVVDAVNAHLTAFAVTATDVAVSDDAATLAATPCPDPGAASRPHGRVRVRVTRVLDNPFSHVVGLVMGNPGRMTITGTGEARVEDTT